MLSLAHNLIHINCAERCGTAALRPASRAAFKAVRACHIFTHGKITLLNQTLGQGSSALPTILSTVCVQNAPLRVLLVSGTDPPPADATHPAVLLDICAGKLSPCVSST